MKSPFQISFLALSIILIFCSAFTKEIEGYDEKLVEVSTAIFNSDRFHMISMKRGSNRIKAKYFAATDPSNNKTVPERYNAWKKGKNIIAVSSGTYMTDCNPANAKPVGLSIDNGVIVNKNLDLKLGGLIIVYQTGGIEATKISDGNLGIIDNGNKKIININNSFDRNNFVAWAKTNEATVFQSHLLVYHDKINTNYCDSKTQSCAKKASRRFLAIGEDHNKEIVHILIHSPSETTLHDGTSKVYKFLKDFKEMNKVQFMINIDTGCQDVFNLYKSDGTKYSKIKGTLDENEAVNLLVYYYE
ncbi:MAG TPA: hypothetical protein VLZ75_01595 [Chitinophagales bacterium]|nr:hypothetical protein [Chitinophagales bacterium]